MPRLSFSLRDVFWLTLVVACLCAWGVEAFRVKKLQESVKRLYNENEELFKKHYPGLLYDGPKRPPPEPVRWGWP
jgi:hypothetical protein